MKKTNQIQQALSIYINQLVYDQKRLGRDIIVLSLGEAFFDIPKILETPKESLEDDERNIETIKKCLNYKTKQILHT